MTREEPIPSPRRSCGYEWCVTEHGNTVHVDDEDHRSEGVGIAVRMRAGGAGRGRLDDWEIGLLRRTADDETWIVVERQGEAPVALPRDAVRALIGAVVADPHLREFCAGGGSGA